MNARDFILTAWRISLRLSKNQEFELKYEP